MSDMIPVTFNLEGKEYKGVLSPVMGAGTSSAFDLMVAGYYWGSLRMSDFTKDWVFHSPSRKMEHLATWFGYVVTAWYQ